MLRPHIILLSIDPVERLLRAGINRNNLADKEKARTVCGTKHTRGTALPPPPTESVRRAAPHKSRIGINRDKYDMTHCKRCSDLIPLTGQMIWSTGSDPSQQILNPQKLHRKTGEELSSLLLPTSHFPSLYSHCFPT